LAEFTCISYQLTIVLPNIAVGTVPSCA